MSYYSRSSGSPSQSGTTWRTSVLSWSSAYAEWNCRAWWSRDRSLSQQGSPLPRGSLGVQQASQGSSPASLRVSNGSKPGQAPYPCTLHCCLFGQIQSHGQSQGSREGTTQRHECREGNTEAGLQTVQHKRIPWTLTLA